MANLVQAGKEVGDAALCACCALGCDCADCDACDVPAMREPVRLRPAEAWRGKA